MSDLPPGFLQDYTQGKFARHLLSVFPVGRYGHVLEVVEPAADFSRPPSEELVIALVLSDAPGRFDVGGAVFRRTLQAGDMVLKRPEVASCVEVYVPHRMCFLSLQSGTLRAHLDGLNDNNDPFDFGALHDSSFRNDFIHSLLTRLEESAKESTARSRLFEDSIVLALLVELLRESEKPIYAPKGGLSPFQLRRVVEYLEDDLSADVCLRELATLVGLSTFHFCRAFKQSTGLPPHRWRLVKRIERACELLLKTEMPVTDIAARVGYDDPSQLASLFRKTLGLSPSRYRRIHRDDRLDCGR